MFLINGMVITSILDGQKWYTVTVEFDPVDKPLLNGMKLKQIADSIAKTLKRVVNINTRLSLL